MKKLLNEIQKQYLNVETGEIEILTTSKTFSIPTTSENFYMTFIENMSGFFNLKSAIEIKLIIKFCCIAEYNTGKVLITSFERRKICEELNITNQQFSNNVSSLKVKNLITGERGTYTVNPMMFWKGTTKERLNQIKEKNLTLTINIE